MATHFILVLDRYARPDRWVYSAIADTAAELVALQCYQDPPTDDPREKFTQVSASPLSKRVCGAAPGSPEDSGTMYQVNDAE